MKQALLALALTMTPITAHAADKSGPVYSQAYTTCLDQAQVRDQAVAACTNEETARWDKSLNQTYQQLLAALDDPARKEALRVSERAWVQYRDADCAYGVSGETVGTLDYVIQADCLLDMTYDRVQTRRAWLEQEKY